MQNNLSRSLQASTYYLSAGGDLRSMYVPWDAPGSGNPGYSYLKCEIVSNFTEVDMYLGNEGDVPAVAAITTALIKQDVDLYALPSDNPSVTPPVWAVPTFAPPIGTGGVVTVVPGGKVNAAFLMSTAKDQGLDTLVVRVHLTGGALKVETWTTGTCELY
jgi:hypothetical protein